MTGKKQDDNSNSAAVAAAVGIGLSGTSFLGLIGRKPPTKDPFLDKSVKRMSLEEISRIAQPGDVILTARSPGFAASKIQAHYGTEFYHVQPVAYKNSKGLGTSISAGILFKNQKETLPYNTATFKEFDKAPSIDKLIRKGGYSDAVLMRPKTPLTKAQQEAFTEEVIKGGKRPYQALRGTLAWLKDVFIPNFKKDAPVIKPGDFKPELGEVCSTLPSNAYTKITGKRVIPNIAPRDIMPADYLRTNSNYDVIGAHLTRKGLSASQMRRRALKARGIIGLTLGVHGAAAAYALSEFLRDRSDSGKPKKED